MDVFLIIIDGFGIGALPDASKYGDAGANTAVHISEVLNGVSWPTLQRWGLGNAADLLDSRIIGCPPCEKPQGWFGIMAEKSSGKDTTTGHWELAGIILEKPFPVFKPEFPSFPPALIDDFVRENAIPGILGNKSASGTVIIEELGEEHIQSRKPVCYTSADSVFQIATHEEIYPLDDLYSMCKKARLICDHYNIGRVIARPFIGKPGNFRRTAGRHDWSIDLPSESLLDHLSQRGVQTVAVGKIGAIFNEQGIDISYHDAGNELCILRTLEMARQKHSNDRFVFVNLVDTDMIFGHRRDPEGYHDAVGPDRQLSWRTGVTSSGG